MPGSRLDEIVANKELEVAGRKKLQSTSDLEKAAAKVDSRFLAALRFAPAERELNLITEIKPKSPSAGVLKQTLSLGAVLESYNKYACAISVLTDEKYFGGSLDLLRDVCDQSTVPTLCKDFILDPHQCFEARLYGAEAVLLIVKILQPAQLGELYEIITKLGMVAVVEVQTEEELNIACSIDASVILINNRNLTTFTIDLGTTERLAPLVPSSAVTIAASGIESRADIDRLLPFCRSFLIGSSLMRADDLELKLAELAGAQRLSGSPHVVRKQ